MEEEGRGLEQEAGRGEGATDGTWGLFPAVAMPSPSCPSCFRGKSVLFPPALSLASSLTFVSQRALNMNNENKIFTIL